MRLEGKKLEYGDGITNGLEKARNKRKKCMKEKACKMKYRRQERSVKDMSDGTRVKNYDIDC